MELELVGIICGFLVSCIALEIKAIKIKPISFIIKWLGKQFNDSLKTEISADMETMKHEMDKRFNEFDKSILSIEIELNGIKVNIKDIEDNSVTKEVRQLRSEIFSFSSRCRMGNNHTKDEFEHLLDQIKRYEELIEKYKITNGVIEVQAEYIKSIYRRRLEKNDFLD